MNEIEAPHLVRGPGRQDVLYLPDVAGGKTGPVDEAILRAVARARNGADQSTLVVARDNRTFRRSFLSRYVEPHASLLNRFALEGQQGVGWVEAHENELTASFFAGAWLLTSSAVPIYTVPRSEMPQDTLVAHESAPHSASHVIARRDAETQIADRIGNLLGCLLVVWAGRALQERSVQKAIEASSALLSPLVLTARVRDAAASVVGSLVSQIETGKPGMIAWEYALEAVLAVFCHANDRQNPRRTDWTKAQLIFDYARRLDGNDEALLLDPKVVRCTIDEPVFWQVFEQAGGGLGFGRFTDENKPKITAFIDAATRIFPEQAAKLWKIEFSPPQDLGDEEALARLRAQLKEAIDELPSTVRLDAVLAGVSVRRRHLLVSITTELTALVLDKKASLPVSDVAQTLRRIIETVNHSGYPEEGARVAEILAKLLASKEAKELPGRERGFMLNEIANCLRYTGQLERALGLYEDALDLVGRDPTDAMARTGLRNRAIILRDVHRYSEARSAFAALRPFAHDDELRGLLLSEAICLYEMGLLAPSLALLEGNRPLIEGRRLNAPHVLEYATLLVTLCLQQDKFEEARALARGLAEAGEQRGYLLASVAAGRVDLATALRNTDPIRRDAALNNAIASMAKIAGEFVGHASIPTMALGAIEDLDLALNRVGRSQEAEELVERLLAHISPEKTPKGWLLYLLLARNMRNLNRREEALTHVILAFKYLDRALWEVSASEDVLAIFSPQASGVMELVRYAFDLSRGQPREFGALLRHGADLRAAPVLSARLRRRVGLPCAGEDIFAEERRVRLLLSQTQAAIVQFVDTGEDVAVVRTLLDARSRLTTDSRFLGLAPELLRKTAGRLRLALRSSDPRAAELDLSRVRGWSELAVRLHACLDDVPSVLPLYVAAGPIGETALSLAFESRSVCFIPSVSGLVALRKTRLGRVRQLQSQLDRWFSFLGWFDRKKRLPYSRQLRWTFRRWFDFAVWFDRELPAEAEALSRVARRGAELATAHGLAHHAVDGKDATGDRLLQGLAEADIARIACHGRVLPDGEAIDLLVAAGGFLPPADLTEVAEADVHVLGWQRLATLSRAPAAVFSSACDSGLTVVNAGGERIGLERPGPSPSSGTAFRSMIPKSCRLFG